MRRLAVGVCSLLIVAGLPGPAGSAQDADRAAYDAMVIALRPETARRGYPEAIARLEAADPALVVAGLRTLAETEDAAAIPWLVESQQGSEGTVRVWAGASLQKLVVAIERRHRNPAETQRRVPDLRPLAYVVDRMLKQPDDGNTHAYAAELVAALGLRRFEPQLRELLESRHPAVTRAAAAALTRLGSDLSEVPIFSVEEMALARTVAEQFAQRFRDDDEDGFAALLPGPEVIPRLFSAELVDARGSDLYGELVAGNLRRFAEFRSVFADLTSLATIEIQPGTFTRSTNYAPGVRLMKNTMVTLSNANRLSVTVKIEDLAFVDGRCHVVTID